PQQGQHPQCSWPRQRHHLATSEPPYGTQGNRTRRDQPGCGTLGASLKIGGTEPSVPSRNPANRPYSSQIYARFIVHSVSAKRSRACSTPACSGGSKATSFSAQRSTGSVLDSPLRTFCACSSTICFRRHHHIFVSWPGLTSGRHLIAFRTLPYSLWRNTLISTVGHTTLLLHSSRIAL
ncbi:unnamed protein product, partial [Ixodes persulcatus]